MEMGFPGIEKYCLPLAMIEQGLEIFFGGGGKITSMFLSANDGDMDTVLD
jgi:hypothetical protein